MPSMNLIEEDYDVIRDWIKNYGDNGDSPKDMVEPDVEAALKDWDKSKRFLYTLLGNQLRISKPVKVAKTTNMLCAELERIMAADSSALKTLLDMNNYWSYFLRRYVLHLNDFNKLSFAYWLQDFFAHSHSYVEDNYVVTNKIDGHIPYDWENGNPNEITINFTNGKSYVIHRGASFCRVVGKMLKLSGATDWEQPFEAFRLWQSQFLNQNQLDGNLVLSIHPIDFMTMSDNSCKWTSCMSWVNNGDYRAGTVEMMNSSNVLIAYLDASTPFKFNSYNLPNKKWRSLIIADPESIINVKGYPYQNAELAAKVCKWIGELMYKNHHITMKLQEREDNLLDYSELGLFNTDVMYNDFCDDSVERFWYLPENLEKPVTINYSGDWTCMCCGRHNYDPDWIYNDDDSDAVSSWVVCAECGSARNAPRCCCCGSIIGPDDGIWLNDNLYCSNCIDDYAVYDWISEEYIDKEDAWRFIALKYETNQAYILFFDPQQIKSRMKLLVKEDAESVIINDQKEIVTVNFNDLTTDGFYYFDNYCLVDFIENI